MPPEGSRLRRSKLVRPILIGGLLTELLDGGYETANDSPDRRLPLSLLVCLDERGNAASLPNFAEIASTAASHNIQLISISTTSPRPAPTPATKPSR